MGKRNNEKRRSKSEQRLDNQRHLSLIERDGKKYPGYSSIFTEKPHYEIKKGDTNEY